MSNFLFETLNAKINKLSKEFTKKPNQARIHHQQFVRGEISLFLTLGCSSADNKTYLYYNCTLYVFKSLPYNPTSTQQYLTHCFLTAKWNDLPKIGYVTFSESMILL